jgi:hypothetical protein
MKWIVKFLRNNKGIVCLVAILLVLGAFLRWEVRELQDPQTGGTVVVYRGIMFPWQTGVLSGEQGRTVSFHVHRWWCYGLVHVEVNGQMTYGSTN